METNLNQLDLQVAEQVEDLLKVIKLHLTGLLVQHLLDMANLAMVVVKMDLVAAVVEL